MDKTMKIWRRVKLKCTVMVTGLPCVQMVLTRTTLVSSAENLASQTARISYLVRYSVILSFIISITEHKIFLWNGINNSKNAHVFFITLHVYVSLPHDFQKAFDKVNHSIKTKCYRSNSETSNFNLKLR